MFEEQYGGTSELVSILAANRQIYESRCVIGFVIWICEFILAFEAGVWNFKVQKIFARWTV